MSHSFLASAVGRAADAAVSSQTFCIVSRNHRQWLEPRLEECGWRASEPATATFLWLLTKKALPKERAHVFNNLPNLLLLDDKAVLALLTRRFTRTQPLVTHVLYGEWDDARVSALRERWADPDCSEPRWWIIKDAHASNGFSAALFDRSVRPIVKRDVAGGYCYVVQEYVEQPMLIEGRKFELRQYVLIKGDGAAYTYEGGLLRLACVPYDPESRDRRAHITNKFVQTGWEAESADGKTLDDIERDTHEWPPYAALFETAIVPLVADLADSIAPLLASVDRKVDRNAHFELFACDLVVSASGRVSLMEVNINCAFGTFHPRTETRLVRPLFDDLISLCVLPAVGVAASPGRWRQVRDSGLDDTAAASAIASQELREHQCYVRAAIRALCPCSGHTCASFPLS
jgi:hypothetical protein